MTRLNWEVRIAESEGKTDDPAVRNRIDSDVGALVRYMLFADEILLHDVVQGVSTFTETFPQRGPRDKQGRSLRDFDLRTRLFRYPLSYMVYSEAFDAIPQTTREHIYQRIFEVLSAKDHSPEFARLSDDDRSAALAILRDTKPNLPAYWQGPASRQP